MQQTLENFFHKILSILSSRKVILVVISFYAAHAHLITNEQLFAVFLSALGIQGILDYNNPVNGLLKNSLVISSTSNQKDDSVIQAVLDEDRPTSPKQEINS